MLRLETRIPFTSDAAHTFFSRTSNYLTSAGGVTDRVRAQLASSGITLQSTDAANPFLQVFKVGVGSNKWVFQATGWIDSTTPLAQGVIQDRWSTSIVNALRDVGLQMSDAEIRRAMDSDATFMMPGGFSKYAPERLRTASGAPNFAPLGAPDGATSWLNNFGALQVFVQGNNTLPTTTGGNTTTTIPGGGGPAVVVRQPQQPEKKTSPAVPVLIIATLLGGVWYLTKSE